MSSSYPNNGPASTPAHSDPPAAPAMDPVVDLLGGDRVIAFRSALAHLGGGALAGLLLSQFWYFSNLDVSRARDGWFYKTMAEIEEETGMTRSEQETARRRLRTLGVLEEDKRGIPMKIWFRVAKDRLFQLLREYASKKGVPGAPGPAAKATTNLAGIPQDCPRQSRKLLQRLLTKNSTETYKR